MSNSANPIIVAEKGENRREFHSHFLLKAYLFIGSLHETHLAKVILRNTISNVNMLASNRLSQLSLSWDIDETELLQRSHDILHHKYCSIQHKAHYPGIQNMSVIF